jgi:hypothetical protein
VGLLLFPVVERADASLELQVRADPRARVHAR